MDVRIIGSTSYSSLSKGISRYSIQALLTHGETFQIRAIAWDRFGYNSVPNDNAEIVDF